jgi:hypothetical protein
MIKHRCLYVTIVVRSNLAHCHVRKQAMHTICGTDKAGEAVTSCCSLCACADARQLASLKKSIAIEVSRSVQHDIAAGLPGLVHQQLTTASQVIKEQVQQQQQQLLEEQLAAVKTQLLQTQAAATHQLQQQIDETMQQVQAELQQHVYESAVSVVESFVPYLKQQSQQGLQQVVTDAVLMELQQQAWQPPAKHDGSNHEFKEDLVRQLQHPLENLLKPQLTASLIQQLPQELEPGLLAALAAPLTSVVQRNMQQVLPVLVEQLLQPMQEALMTSMQEPLLQQLQDLLYRHDLQSGSNGQQEQLLHSAQDEQHLLEANSVDDADSLMSAEQQSPCSQQPSCQTAAVHAAYHQQGAGGEGAAQGGSAAQGTGAGLTEDQQALLQQWQEESYDKAQSSVILAEQAVWWQGEGGQLDTIGSAVAQHQEHEQQDAVDRSILHGKYGERELEAEVSHLHGLDGVSDEPVSVVTAESLEDDWRDLPPEDDHHQLQWQQGIEQAGFAAAVDEDVSANEHQHVAADLLDHQQDDPEDYSWWYNMAAEEHISVEQLDQQHVDEENTIRQELKAGQDMDIDMHDAQVQVEDLDLLDTYQTDQGEVRGSLAGPASIDRLGRSDQGADDEQPQPSSGCDDAVLVAVKPSYPKEDDPADYMYDDSAPEAQPPSSHHYYPSAYEHLTAVGNSSGMEDYYDDDDSVESYGHEPSRQHLTAMQASS